MFQEALIYALLAVAVLIEGAIFYSIPWQFVGAEFIRVLGQLFPTAPTMSSPEP